MSSDDIANLFRQFGGAPDSYKELGRDNVVRQSRERWPLLADVRAQDAARRIESVRVGEEHRHDGPAPLVFDESGVERAAAEARTRVATPAPAARPVIDTFARRSGGRVEPELQPETFVEVVGGAPASAAAPAPAPAGTELQGLFSRLARHPEPTAPAADPEVSLLRRLLKP